MKAVVVYESLWGNTAAIARAIAEGFGPEAKALSTLEATPVAIEGAGLIVAGAPVLGFNLPTESMRKGIANNPAQQGPTPPNFSLPLLRSWLDALPRGSGRCAAFETRIWWSPGGATKAIEKKLGSAGYSVIAKAQRYIVTGTYGPLKASEIERARAWGAELAKAMG